MSSVFNSILENEPISDDIIIRGPPAIYEPAKGGLGYEIFRSFNLNKGKIAQIFPECDITTPYETLLVRSIRTAVYLSKKELKKDDIVCLCSGNEVDSIVPFISSTFVGTTYASIESFLPEDHIIHYLNYIKPTILFVSEESEAKVEACLEKSYINCEMIILGKSVKNINFSSLQVPSDEEKSFQPVFINDLKDTAVIFLSSGTTGYSKGICVNHYSLLAQVFILFDYNFRQGSISSSNFMKKFDDREEIKLLFHSPMYWITGILFSLSLFFSGGTWIVGSSFNAENSWKVIRKYKPNSMYFPPGQAIEICSYAIDNDKEPYTTLNVFLIHGVGVTEHHLKSMKKCFPKSKNVQGYGLTECSGDATGFNIDDPEEMMFTEILPYSSGRALPTFKMKVVDIENGKTLGIGMKGELRLKSDYMMNGYYKMDSSSAFDSDGWFKTGDLVYVDQDHCLHVIDRIKDIIPSGLYWIHPSVIENILSQHPAVLESFVFGYPHLKDGEHALPVVVLREEYKNKVSDVELISFINERVPHDFYEIQAGIKFLDRMLKAPNGKLRKHEMKQLIIAGTI